MRVLLCLSLCVSEWAAMADGARCEPKPHVQRLPPITEGFWRSANSELELRWSRHPTAPRVTFELTLHSDRYSWFGLGVSTEGEMVSQETTALLPGSAALIVSWGRVPGGQSAPPAALRYRLSGYSVAGVRRLPGFAQPQDGATAVTREDGVSRLYFAMGYTTQCDSGKFAVNADRPTTFIIARGLDDQWKRAHHRGDAYAISLAIPPHDPSLVKPEREEANDPLPLPATIPLPPPPLPPPIPALSPPPHPPPIPATTRPLPQPLPHPLPHPISCLFHHPLPHPLPQPLTAPLPPPP